MKKSIALVIALIMVFGCMLSIMPMAEATDTPAADAPASDYSPVIAYSNVNYTEGMTLMFAVPAPASLPEGSSVKVILWDTASILYSYNESVATADNPATAKTLEAEATKSTIDGKEYLVFKYDGLTAKEMTDVVYVRPVVVNADNKATAYGPVVDYSVLEYVKTAKGEFDGTPALANTEILGLLDSMVEFGALSQIFLGGDEAYAPNGFLANEELNKIWVTPVVSGVTKDKVFAGFFKYEEGGFATVNFPHYDGVSISVYKNAAGEAIEDAYESSSEAAFGFQVPAVDGDINLTVVYEPKAIRSFAAEELGAGFYVDNSSTDSMVGDPEKLAAAGAGFGLKSGAPIITTFNYNKTFSSNFSGEAYKEDGYGRKNYYHGAKTVADPSNPDNLVLQFSATGAPTVQFKDTKATDWNGFGYGDTVEDAITIEFAIGKPTPDANVTTGKFYFRNREASIKSIFTETNAAGKLVTTINGKEYYQNMHDTYVFAVTNNEVHLQLGAATKGDVVCTLPDTGLVKVAFTVFSNGYVCAYASDENGNMVKTAEGQLEMHARFADYNAQHLANLADEDPSNDAVLAPFADFSSWFTMNTLNIYWNMGAGQHGGKGTDAAFISESVVIDGVETPLKNEDGSYNKKAIQAYAEQNFSVLLDDLKIFGGSLYE